MRRAGREGDEESPHEIIGQRRGGRVGEKGAQATDVGHVLHHNPLLVRKIHPTAHKNVTQILFPVELQQLRISNRGLTMIIQ